MIESAPLRVLQGIFAVCRLAVGEPMPAWGLNGGFYSITRTAAELSVICEQRFVPAGVLCERDWRMFEVIGPLDFSLVGILSSITGALSLHGISAFALSTYDTDYILVKEKDFAASKEALVCEGFLVEG